VVDAPVGSIEDINVQVTAAHSKRVPTGYVALWDSDIPSAVRFLPHTPVGRGSRGHAVCLDSNGDATFELQESLPGVPFDVKVPSGDLYYVPSPSTRFAGNDYSTSFELRMHLWPAQLSVTLGRDDGNGQATPIDVSVSSPGPTMPGRETVPAGNIVVSDPFNGCESVVSGAFPYRGTGQATLDVDLPAGQNALDFTYTGDAFFGSDQVSVTPSDVSTGGWTSCPTTNWATLAPQTYVPPSSGSDIPMFNYGFPPTTLDRTNTICCFGAYSPAALANPQVGTLVVQLDWSDVEPLAPVPDFALVDAEVNAAISQGKKIALLLRFQAGSVLSGTTNSCDYTTQLLPSWVVADLAATSESFCSLGTGLTIPEYWGAEFMYPWMAFVDQVAAHFSYDCSILANQIQSICVDTANQYQPSDITYVRAPVGLGDEAKPITGPNSKPTPADVRKLDTMGYTPQLWEAWQEDMLSFYKQAFAYSPWVLYSVNQQDKCVGAAQVSVATFQPQTISCTGNTVDVDVAEWAVDHGFGLAQNSLDPCWVYQRTDPIRADPQPGYVNTIFAYALSHDPRPFIELQPDEALSTWCNPDVARGLSPCYANPKVFLDAEYDVSFARSHGISAIEWYDAECVTGSAWCHDPATNLRTPDDLTNPVLQPIICLWRRLEAIPGTDRIPTIVTATSADFTVKAGARLDVRITIAAPGLAGCPASGNGNADVAGFIPGGTVQLFDDYTGELLGKPVTIAPDTGTVTVRVKVPGNGNSHIDLAATYSDNTWLWLPSTSSDTRVVVTH